MDLEQQLREAEKKVANLEMQLAAMDKLRGYSIEQIRARDTTIRGLASLLESVSTHIGQIQDRLEFYKDAENYKLRDLNKVPPHENLGLADGAYWPGGMCAPAVISDGGARARGEIA